MATENWTLASVRRTVLPTLTKLQHVSAPFLGTFLLIHLSAPLVANIGGSQLSSQVMLLGREYYQTLIGEPLFVVIPLGVHVTAGIVKRLLTPRPIASIRDRPRLLTLAAYPLVFLATVHLFSHRNYPQDPSPPILGVGPSELDFEFVKTGLHTWPLRSWTLYAGLVGFATLHAVEGCNVIYRRWVPKFLKLVKNEKEKEQPADQVAVQESDEGANEIVFTTKRRLVVAAAVTLAILSGVFVLSREPIWALSDRTERYRAALAQSFWYRW